MLESQIAEKNKSNSEPTQYLYREAIGSLMYLMMGSRLDLAFAAAKLAQFFEAPMTAHSNAANRVLSIR